MPRRTTTAALSLVGAVALGVLGAAPAHADDPTVAYPTRESLATGNAAFAVNQTPTGRVTTVQFATTNAPSATGGLAGANIADDGETLMNVPEAGGVVTASRPSFAGTYYWTYAWRPVNANGTTGDVRWSSVRDFTMPAQIAKVTIGKPYQHPTRPDAGVTGTLVTNVREGALRCTVTSGGKQVAKKSGRFYASAPMTPVKWACLQLRIPESYDGKKLTLTVTVTGAGRTAKAAKTFTGR